MADYWRLYQEAKALYFSLGRVWCLALGEHVLFDRRGFRHFLIKGRRRRPMRDQIRRFKLFFEIKEAMAMAETIVQEKEKDAASFIVLISDKGSGRIKIILGKDALGNKYFVSIMDM